MHRGYVKLYRKSIENPLFKKPLIWHYFEYCLLKANHKDKKMIWNKKEITIERGSFLTGRIEAAKETGLSEQNVRTAQKTLINVGALLKINEKSTSKNTYLTICNYDDYQEDKKLTNQQSTSNQPAINQQSTTTKNEQTPIITNKKKPYSEEFEIWWKIFKGNPAHGKGDKSKTFTEFKKIKPDQHPDLKTGTENYGKTTDGSYKAVNFLKQEIWKLHIVLQVSQNNAGFNKPGVKTLDQIIEEKRAVLKPDFDIEIQAESQ